MKMNSSIAMVATIMGVLLGNYAVLSQNADTKHQADANSTNNNATSGIAEKISAYSAPFVTHDVSSWSNEIGQALFASAVVVSGLAIVGVLAWLLTPFFGHKFCALFGNCGTGDHNNENVAVNGGEDFSSLYPFPIGYRYNAPYAGYRKRSLNYVGPVLKMLSSAYEKFEEFSSTTPKSD